MSTRTHTCMQLIATYLLNVMNLGEPQTVCHGKMSISMPINTVTVMSEMKTGFVLTVKSKEITRSHRLPLYRHICFIYLFTVMYRSGGQSSCNQNFE